MSFVKIVFLLSFLFSPVYFVHATVASDQTQWLKIPARNTWDGDVVCHENRCRILVVEHSDSFFAVHEVNGRQVKKIDRVPAGFHPDSAKWINHTHFVGAIEIPSVLRYYRLDSTAIEQLAEVAVDFQPRYVHLLTAADQPTVKLMLTPYRGRRVAVVELDTRSGTFADTVVYHETCETPWHPVNLPAESHEWRVAVGCLDDKRLVQIESQSGVISTQTLYEFRHVPRSLYVDNEYLYIALELGGYVARENMRTGQRQMLKAPRWGAFAVAKLEDDVFVWGEDDRVFIQKYDAKGEVLCQDELPTSGMSTTLRIVDLDGDGEKDLVVFNSTGRHVDIHFGPLTRSSCFKGATP